MDHDYLLDYLLDYLISVSNPYNSYRLIYYSVQPKIWKTSFIQKKSHWHNLPLNFK